MAEKVPTVWSINLNVEALVQGLAIALQRTSDIVKFALLAADNAVEVISESWSTGFPGVDVPFLMAKSQMLDATTAAEPFRT